RRMVDPFVFLDQMGPHVFTSGQGLDVRPHPHIGLATVTYLFDGEILHRDSLGSVQAIHPGDVNWMHAGRGIVHSERTAPAVRRNESSLFGLQAWVALPRAHEETHPAFVHIGKTELPLVEGEGVSVRLIAGSILGRRSAAPTRSDMFYADARLEPGARLHLPAEYPEQAVYIAQGTLDLGRDGSFSAGQLLVIKPGQDLTLAAGAAVPVRLMLLG